MSYKDDEEFKEDDIDDEDEALLGADADPLDDDLTLDDPIEEDDDMEGFASLDGSEY